MCSPMLTTQAAPTSASLLQGACCDIPPAHEKYEAEFNPLHMKWVLVDDAKRNRRAQMRWLVDRQPRIIMYDLHRSLFHAPRVTEMVVAAIGQSRAQGFRRTSVADICLQLSLQC